VIKLPIYRYILVCVLQLRTMQTDEQSVSSVFRIAFHKIRRCHKIWWRWKPTGSPVGGNRQTHTPNNVSLGKRLPRWLVYHRQCYKRFSISATLFLPPNCLITDLRAMDLVRFISIGDYIFSCNGAPQGDRGYSQRVTFPQPHGQARGY
jgi:hypothetical protein